VWPFRAPESIGGDGGTRDAALELAALSMSTLAAVRLTGRLEGMISAPVYERKSMAALIDLVTSREDLCH
jgi:1-aminocyclopropane-1-carboxylate deaminase/D-cysteine desulfhydrase-like pyridoxal-dependent ACC family enzyme